MQQQPIYIFTRCPRLLLLTILSFSRDRLHSLTLLFDVEISPTDIRACTISTNIFAELNEPTFDPIASIDERYINPRSPSLYRARERDRLSSGHGRTVCTCNRMSHARVHARCSIKLLWLQRVNL